MSEQHQSEIDQNYDFFQRNLNSLLSDHRGEYALIRRRRIVGFYSGPGEAYRDGLSRYPDELFSIQEIEDRPAEMGLTSLAFD
jgi:hypothetical protein